MLRKLGVPIKAPTNLCRDNKEIIIYITNPYSKLKKNHTEISYSKLRKKPAASIFNSVKNFITVNQSNILMQLVATDKLGSFPGK